MDPTSRLRLATRIHFSLMRQFDEVVEVRDLLDKTANGREALWVCEASGDAELMSLAREFGRATRRMATTAPKQASLAPAETRAGGQVPQDTSWAQDTSGFGLSQPAELKPRSLRAGAAASASTAPSWFAPMDWLRRGASR